MITSNAYQPRVAGPRHVAVVMDGNGRWATKRFLPRVAGHKKGVETVRTIIQVAAKARIEHLTLFAFSSENWRRPVDEVNALLELFIAALEREVDKLAQAQVRLRLVGDLLRFPEKLQTQIRKAHAKTANMTGLTVNVCVNYGGRWDIVNAVQTLMKNQVEISAITEKAIGEALQIPDAGDVDLVIRTGGEQRISNFLLWQSAYSELYFTEVLWPDFSAHDFEQALEWFASRERRFGRTGEQTQREDFGEQ